MIIHKKGLFCTMNKVKINTFYAFYSTQTHQSIFYEIQLRMLKNHKFFEI